MSPTAAHGKAVRILARWLDRPLSFVNEGIETAREGGYETWTVPKGDGRSRRIDAPFRPLRELQRCLLDRLLYQAPTSPCAHGFVPERSVVTNALVHAPTARALVSVDLEDAYPSVTRPRVRSTLEWALGPLIVDSLPSSEREVRDALWDLIADVCTHEGRLPQGAPSSGAVLNLVCVRLDRHCSRLVWDWSSQLENLRYSRYADDLSFTASTEIPGEFVDDVRRAVVRSGFRVNRRKVRRTTDRHGALVVCGVRIAGGKVGLPRSTLRRYRAILHRVLRDSPASVPQEARDLVHGVLGHLTMVTSQCPRLLEGPLRRWVADHGEWLRVSVASAETEVKWPRYGVLRRVDV